MEKIITRREFLSQTVVNNALKDKKDPEKDPFFEKYANREMPFANARTNSGLDLYTSTLSEKDLLHLLRRTTFGATTQSVNTLKSMTLVQAVDYLVDNPQIPNSYPVNVYQPWYPDTQGCPFDTSWVYFNAPDNDDHVLAQNRISYSFKPWWFGEMINQPTHLMEKMTLFWANHFGAQTEDFNTPKAIFQHYNTLRTHGLGNFRTLIKAITIDPHMLMFQNGNYNTASAPDENYARELQELFTVGKGPASVYTENDVQQAAKILTGWRRLAQPTGFYTSYFKDSEHDDSNKQFSSFYNNRVIAGRAGQDGQYETDDLIDMILSVDEVAKYICRRIYRWFVYYVIDDAAEQNVIAPLASIFRAHNYEIAPVLKALFCSEHFFDPVNRGCIIKSPIDLYVACAREFGIPIPVSPQSDKYRHWQHYKDKCDEVGQKLADPPNVAGWPAYYQYPVFYQIWMNADTVKKRLNAITSYIDAYGYPLSNSSTTVKINSISYNMQFPNPQDPNEVVRNFCRYLLPQDVSAAQTAYMKNILVKQGADHYWSDAWNTYVYDTSNDIARVTVQERLNDLIRHIITLEEYQLY
ncbi:MAG: DUF1800 domain-containing protein [Chitinophagaceae bacterium]